MSIGLISKWCHDLVEAKKDEIRRKVLELYLQYLSQDEIGTKSFDTLGFECSVLFSLMLNGANLRLSCGISGING